VGQTDILRAPLVIEYPFSRTTGPLVGGFLTGLREGVLLGVRTSDGRVVVPPTEADPTTGADLSELVEVGPGGTVTTWAWVSAPRPKDPLDAPFAWALVRPDGADTAMLHAIAAGGIDEMRTGMRVILRWRPDGEREGAIGDIECFVPEGSAEAPLDQLQRPSGAMDTERVRSVRIPARLEYTYTAGGATSRFLRGIAQKRILGERCPVCQKVYVPPRGACPTDGVPTREQVDLAHVGTVVSFCVVNVQFYGSVMEIPYVSANIQLDGADLPLMHLIQECAADEVHIGMRVAAVWVPDDEIGPTLESIRYFRPTGEPDVDPESSYA
jgi:uncharacterized OB-fold protein